MKRYLYMTFAVLGLLGSTVPHAEAGNLTGVRVSNHEGTSRIVLDVSEMPVSWTQSYNEETHALTLIPFTMYFSLCFEPFILSKFFIS